MYIFYLPSLCPATLTEIVSGTNFCRPTITFVFRSYVRSKSFVHTTCWRIGRRELLRHLSRTSKRKRGCDAETDGRLENTPSAYSHQLTSRARSGESRLAYRKSEHRPFWSIGLYYPEGPSRTSKCFVCARVQCNSKCALAALLQCKLTAPEFVMI